MTLTLRPSGWTYRRTFVLYDEETETLWYPLEGTEGLTGIAGPLADRVLSEIKSTRTSWNLWKQKHPDSKFMDYPFSQGRWGR